jgi:hypothetical protein
MLLDDFNANRSLYYVDPSTDVITSKDWGSVLSKAPECTPQNPSPSMQDLQMDADLGSSFVDMNADCRPDILLQSLGENHQRVQEFYLYSNDGFCLVSKQ